MTGAAVQDAIRRGVLRACLTPEGKIRSAEEADREWEAGTISDKRPVTGPASAEGAAGSPAQASLAIVRTRLDTAKADLAELDLAQRRGELVRAADVEARLSGLFGSCRTKLLAIPSRARQDDPTLSPAQIALLEGLIREALEALSEADG